MNPLKNLNPYFFRYKKLFIVGILFIFLTNFFSTYSVFFIGNSINLIENYLINLSNDSFFLLFKTSFLIFFFALISGIFKFYMRQTIIVASRKIENEIKNDVYSHYQILSNTFYSQNKIGDLMNRITEDIAAIRMHIGPGIMYQIDLVCKLICILYFLLRIDLYLTFYSLIPFPFLSLAIYLVSNKISKKSKQLQENQSKISSFVQDSFSGIRVIQSFAKEEKIISDYELIAKNYKNKAISLAKTEAYFFPLMVLIIGLSNLLILYIGGLLATQDKINTGDIANFFIYINLLIWPFASLGWVSSIRQRAKVSMIRINNFLNTKSDILKTGNLYFNFKTIEFKNVSYIYPNTKILALDNVSFTIKKLKSLSIIGKTGSGKTTIILLVTRLIDPTKGEILVNGINITQYSMHSIREKISVVPQDSFLFSQTIEENILLGKPNASYQQMKDSTQKVCIHDSIQKFDKKYKTKVGTRGITLSGGQKQRISIARAIVTNPEILLLDDSFSVVDVKTEKKIFSNLKNEMNQKTYVIITNQISITQHTDYVIILEGGKIIQKGIPQELIQKKGNYQKLYKKQLKTNLVF